IADILLLRTPVSKLAQGIPERELIERLRAKGHAAEHIETALADLRREGLIYRQASKSGGSCPVFIDVILQTPALSLWLIEKPSGPAEATPGRGISPPQVPNDPFACPTCGRSLSEHERSLQEAFRCPGCDSQEFHSGLLYVPVGSSKPAPPKRVRVHALYWK